MRRSTAWTAVAAGVAASMCLVTGQPRVWAHCEVPCGIYDDHARIGAMLEDATTIAKAVDQATALAGKHDPQSVNQATRWIVTKDEHATGIQHSISQYFLTQRVKPAQPGSPGWADYATKLAHHHAVLVAAMKTKQSVDPARVAELRAAIERLNVYYPPSEHTHATTAPRQRSP
ncbi:MAG: superoxide dismutase [Ni] [Planctomycetota bacterium]|jgi:nickel superoxide dismutase